MSVLTQAKRIFFGKPIATKNAHHQRLDKIFALPVFASDALSSVAYSTEATMTVLLLAGMGALHITTPISIAIAVLIVLVSASYYQTLHSYPHGGGSYTVASDNLGSIAGRVAGASLLIDYVLTVAVSVTAGVLALVSIFPILTHFLIQVNILCVLFIAVINLRGTKESGVVFAIPTYSFVLLTVVMIVIGLIRLPSLHVGGFFNPNPPTKQLEALSLFLVLRAFASGCSAMTGIEAISNGIQAFKKPESRNASITLVWMSIMLVSMVLGTSWLASRLHVVPFLDQGTHGYKTVLAMLCERIFGNGAFLYALQIATALILILAANTAFADFPRLSSMIARDGFLPRQLASVGDRLVFQNGIIVLAALSMLLIVMFSGHTDALIPLYAIGVFTAFTLSQFGMVIHQVRRKKYFTMVPSLIGGLSTMVVAAVILATKVTEGGWIVLVALAIFLTIFWGVSKHYRYLARELSITPDDTLKPIKTIGLLLVPSGNVSMRQAVQYAKTIAREVRALHVVVPPERTEDIQAEWKAVCDDIPLEIVESSDKDVQDAVTGFIDTLVGADPNIIVTVIVPHSLPRGFPALFQTARARLKRALKRKKNVVITAVTAEESLKQVHSTVLLLVPRLHRGILQAISYARSMARDVRALHVTLDPQGAQNVKEDWNKFGADMPMVILDSPYRSLLEPVTEYIDQAIAENPDSLITIIVPQAVPKHWWQGLLHNNAAIPLKMALRSRPNVIVTNVRYFLK